MNLFLNTKLCAYCKILLLFSPVNVEVSPALAGEVLQDLYSVAMLSVFSLRALALTFKCCVQETGSTVLRLRQYLFLVYGCGRERWSMKTN